MTTTSKDKAILCKHCNISYPATKDHFYTCYGKLQLNICKECKKTKSRVSEKIRKHRDRKKYMREYHRKYRLKKKLEKEKELENSKNK